MSETSNSIHVGSSPNALKIKLTEFPDHRYATDQAERLEAAKQNRNRTIEWSFGIVGILLAAAVAAPSQTTLLPLLISVAAGVLTIQLTALAAGDHAACRSLGVIGAHLNYLRLPVLIPEPAKFSLNQFRAHTIHVIIQVDFLGARLQTRRSLFFNVLLFGPGYLFAAALFMNLYSLNLNRETLESAFSTYWAVGFVLILVPYVVLSVIAWRGSLNKNEADLTGLEGCPVCSEQNPSKLKPSKGFRKQADLLRETFVQAIGHGTQLTLENAVHTVEGAAAI